MSGSLTEDCGIPLFMTEPGHSKQSIFIATSLSTVLYVALLSPFDVIKNSQIYSTKKLSITQAVKLAKAKSGLRGLWRGVWASLGAVGINNLVYYPLYERVKGPLGEELGAVGSGVAGGISRSVSVLLASPVEMYRTKIQATGTGVFLRRFNGLRATITRDIVFSTVFFFFTENLNVKLKDWGELNARSASIVIGSTVAAFLTHPFDVLKTKLQTKGCLYEKYEKKTVRGVLCIGKTEGVAELSKGLFSRSLKIVPGLVIYLNSYEFIKKIVDSG